MKDYYLHLAGLRTHLRTPHDITISDRLHPFLCAAPTAIDCTITVQPLPVLPTPSAEGVWYGLEYYDCAQGSLRVFHCHQPQGDPFAVTVTNPHGDVTVDVLPEYLSYFTGSSGIFNRIGMETLLLQHDGLLLHASLIQYGHRAIAFSGPSGVGKSTQARLWHTHQGATILNGDRAALRRQDGVWTAYGSPYAGTSGIYRHGSAPLEAVVVLRQGQENCLERLSVTAGVSALYPETSIHHWDPHFVAPATDLLLSLATDVPVYRLTCLPNADAVTLLKKGLSL